MKKWLGLMAICGISLSSLSCGSSQQLLSIAITPSSATFVSPDPTVTIQLKAYGTYTHPPATKDLTTLVTWSTNVPIVAVVSDTGVLSPAGQGCGGAIISASMLTNQPTGNTVVGTITVTVDNAADPLCPQPAISTHK
jgi:hypothetical protein